MIAHHKKNYTIHGEMMLHEIAFIAEHYETKSDAEIGAALGRPYHCIRNYRRKHSLLKKQGNAKGWNKGREHAKPKEPENDGVSNLMQSFLSGRI